MGYADSVSVASAHITTTGSPVQIENFLIVAKTNLADVICCTAGNIQKMGSNKNTHGPYSYLIDTVLLNYGSSNGSICII